MTVNQAEFTKSPMMYEKRNDRSPKPSAFEMKATPRTNLRFVLVFRPAGSLYHSFGHHHLSYDTEEIAPPISIAIHQSPIAVTAAPDKSVA